MSDIKVGDYFKATYTRDPSVVSFDRCEYTVRTVEGNQEIAGLGNYYVSNRWTFEVVEKPWTLPTEDGLYINGAVQPTVSAVVFRLDDGVWDALNDDSVANRHYDGSVQKWLEHKKFDLVRLVREK